MKEFFQRGWGSYCKRENMLTRRPMLRVRVLYREDETRRKRVRKEAGRERHCQSVCPVSLFSGGAVNKGPKPGARRKEKPNQGLGNKHFVPIDQWRQFNW